LAGPILDVAAEDRCESEIEAPRAYCPVEPEKIQAQRASPL